MDYKVMMNDLKVDKITEENQSSTLLLCSVYFQEGKFDLCIKTAKAALEYHPNKIELMIYLGSAYRAVGMQYDAVDVLGKVYSLCPDNIHIGNELAQSLICIGEVDRALAVYFGMLKLKPYVLYFQVAVGNILKLQGKIQEAKAWFAKIVGWRPDCVEAMFQLGCICRGEGEVWLAIHYFEKCVIYNPAFLEGQVALANAFSSVKLFDRSIPIYGKVLHSAPENVESIVNLGTAYMEKGLFDLAAQYYSKAVDLRPCDEYLAYLGNAYKESGLSAEAEKCYERSLSFNNNNIDSLNNLANIRREAGFVSVAISLYKHALKVSPRMTVALSNLGSIYHQLGKYSESFSYYDEAIRINPNFVDGLINLGCLYKDLQDVTNALNCFNRAVMVNPYAAEAHNHIGTIYRDSAKYSDAAVYFKKALMLKPQFADAYCNLSHCCLVSCDWAQYDQRVAHVVEIVEKQLNRNRLPPVHPHHTMLYAPLAGELSIKIAQKYANACLEKVRPLKTYKFSSGERIRVGYVSYDFANHPTSHLMQSVPGLHNKEHFEVFCYALNPSDGTNFRNRIAEEVEHFVDLSKVTDNRVAADMINSDGIDILININGYTKGARNEIFAQRPAPIQSMWLGYPNTSGASFMDYIILDKTTAPLSLAHLYSECLAHMRVSFFVGDHLQMFKHLHNRYEFEGGIINFPDKSVLFDVVSDSPGRIYDSSEAIPKFDVAAAVKELSSNTEVPLCKGDKLVLGSSLQKLYPRCASGEESCPFGVYTSRRMYNLPEDEIVFCNFNQLYKYDPHTFDLWCRILHSVPNSVLWLLMFPPGGEANIYEYAKRNNIPQNRIVFSTVVPKEEHVRRGQLADVCLDTFLCNGHTTGVDILFGGTPMVTLAGKHLASRVAGSQLTAIGCPELVATSEDYYVEIAVKLGTDLAFLAETKSKVRENRFRTTLFNVGSYVTDLENLYRKMVEQHNSFGHPVHLLNEDSL